MSGRTPAILSFLTICSYVSSKVSIHETVKLNITFKLSSLLSDKLPLLQKYKESYIPYCPVSVMWLLYTTSSFKASAWTLLLVFFFMRGREES